MSSLERHGADMLRAFGDASLAVMHVDLENVFFKPGKTDGAFIAANAVSCYARDIDVSNYWVMYTSRWHVGTVEDYKAHHPVMYGFHATQNPGKRDTVMEKRGQGLFGGPDGKAAARLHADKIDTLLVTGVYHDQCVADTIRGALNEGFRVYAVADATDCPPSAYEFMGREILKPVSRHLHDRLSVTTLSLVQQVLKPATELVCSFSPRAGLKVSLG